MIVRVLLVAYVFMVSTPAFAAGEIIRPTLELTDINLVIVWTDASGVRAATRQYRLDAGRPSKAIRYFTTPIHYGFSVLTRNRETGRYTCRVWSEKPQRVDDAATTTVGHEVAIHCLLGHSHD